MKEAAEGTKRHLGKLYLFELACTEMKDYVARHNKTLHFREVRQRVDIYACW
jgi:hypothetical protein